MSQINTRVTASSLGAILTLTGNVGGAAPPTAGNINTVGDGVTINVTGNPGTSTLTFASTGVFQVNYTRVNTTPYVVLPTDVFLGVDVLAIPITIRLPNLPTAGRVYMVKDIFGNCANNNIIITTVGGITLIDGAASFTMNTNFESVMIVFDGIFYAIF